MAYKTKGVFACMWSIFFTFGVFNGFITGVSAAYPYDFQQGFAQGAFQQSAYPYATSFAQQQLPVSSQLMQQSVFPSNAQQEQISFAGNSQIMQQSASPFFAQQQISFDEASRLAQQQQFGQSTATGNGEIMMVDLASGQMIPGAVMGNMVGTKPKVQRKELTRTPDAYDVLFSTSLLLLLTKFFDFIL